MHFCIQISLFYLKKKKKVDFFFLQSIWSIDKFLSLWHQADISASMLRPWQALLFLLAAFVGENLHASVVSGDLSTSGTDAFAQECGHACMDYIYSRLRSGRCLLSHFQMWSSWFKSSCDSTWNLHLSSFVCFSGCFTFLQRQLICRAENTASELLERLTWQFKLSTVKWLRDYVERFA